MPLGFAAEVGSSWRRVVQHGRRRAEEMREAATTVADAGIASRMATATADLQAWMAGLRADGVFADAAAEASWRELADCVLRPARDARPGADADSKLA
jgi:hypothetical protein